MAADTAVLQGSIYGDSTGSRFGVNKVYLYDRIAHAIGKDQSICDNSILNSFMTIIKVRY